MSKAPENMKPRETCANQALRLTRAARRERKLEDRRERYTSNGNFYLTNLRAKQEARTAVYRLIFGEANTGLGVNDPQRDSRRKPRYSIQEYRDAGFALSKLIPGCGFALDRIKDLNKRFNALRPKRCEATFDFTPPDAPAGHVFVDMKLPDITQPVTMGFDLALKPNYEQFDNTSLPERTPIKLDIETAFDAPQMEFADGAADEIPQAVEPPKRKRKVAKASDTEQPVDEPKKRKTRAKKSATVDV